MSNIVDENLLPPEKCQFMKYNKEAFVRIGDAHANYFKNRLGLRGDARVLEIGSGNGRIASSLVRHLKNVEYVGVEIMKDYVDWCSAAYKDYSNFSFQHINVHNAFYNKTGEIQASDFKFPFEDESFDFIYLTSVFTHMHKADIENYLSEIRRMLRNGANCFITYFIVDSETLKLIHEDKTKRKFIEYSDDSYVVNVDRPEIAVAYKRSYIESLYREKNLMVNSIDYGSWRGLNENVPAKHNQDRIVATK